MWLNSQRLWVRNARSLACFREESSRMVAGSSQCSREAVMLQTREWESLSPRTRPGAGACCTLGYLEDTVEATDKKICVQPHVTWPNESSWIKINSFQLGRINACNIHWGHSLCSWHSAKSITNTLAHTGHKTLWVRLHFRDEETVRLEELINAFKTMQFGSVGLGVNPGLPIIKTSALSFWTFLDQLKMEDCL